MVLMLVAVASVLGLSYVTSSTVKVRGAQNMVYAAEAQYLAESGLQHALYVLEMDPELLDGSSGNPLGPFHLDGGPYSYSFWAQAAESIPGVYYLYSQGSAGGITRRSRYTVYRGLAVREQVTHGVVIGGTGASLPNSVSITGDIFNNGDFLLNFARIDGDVSSCGTVFDPFNLIDGSVATGVEPIDFPDVDMEYYKAYGLGEDGYVALELTTEHLEADNPLNNGGAITDQNVGGVVWLKPVGNERVRLRDNVNFEGTIIIDGDLVIDGQGITLTAVDGFPALITTGRALVSANSEITINGLVVARGGIAPRDGQAEGSSTTINGALIADWLGYDPSLQGNHQLNYNAEYCSVYDFSAQPAGGGPRIALKLIAYD